MEVATWPRNVFATPGADSVLGASARHVGLAGDVGDAAILRTEPLISLVSGEHHATLVAAPIGDTATPSTNDVTGVRTKALRPSIPHERKERRAAGIATLGRLRSLRHDVSLAGRIDIDARNADLAVERMGMFVDIETFGEVAA